MWTRVVAKLLALMGLYAIVLAGLGMRFSGQSNSGSYKLTLVEIGVATAVFVAIAAIMVTRRPSRPTE